MINIIMAGKQYVQITFSWKEKVTRRWKKNCAMFVEMIYCHIYPCLKHDNSIMKIPKDDN